MPNIKVMDMTGKEVGEMTLSDLIFGAKVNEAVLHAAVRAYLMNQRQGTQSTLTRTEVSGGGKKPWKQKGTGHARQGSPDLQLSKERFRGLMEFIKKTRKEGRINASYGCEGFLGEYEGEVRDHLYTCQAGLSVASVLIDGSISACGSIRSDFHQGNIYKDDFIDVWENRFQPYRDRSWMKKDQCAGCKWFRYCQGNGMHLRDDNGDLILCHLDRLK